MAKRVAVIGLGPTGSFAARAAYDMGWEVKIYVHGNAYGTPPGAFWLHWIPKGIVEDYTPQTITMHGLGNEKNYIRRQWGKLYPNITSSFPVKPVQETGYDPDEVLKSLVPDACELIPVPHRLSDTDVRDIAKAFDVVFQTFPTAESKEHQPGLIPYVAAARFGWMPKPENGNIVVYNGTDSGIVVREAQLFGNHYLEFPKGMDMEEVESSHHLSGYQLVVLRDLHPYTRPWANDPKSKVQLVGRFAKWDRKCLSHDAYADVQKVLENME